MSKFIAISGPASSGKTSLIDNLTTFPELSKAVFSPDLYNHVWNSLLEQGVFNSFDEIVGDPEYTCVYIVRLIDYYKDYIARYKETDDLVILDCCWIDLLVYGLVNMWCARPIKEVQVELLSRILDLSKTVDQIYVTRYDTNKKFQQKFRSELRIYNNKGSRPLELKYYDICSIFNNTTLLPNSDMSDSSLFIIDDLKKLGYL